MADSKFTPEIAKVIYKNLKNGATFETAAQAVGITRQTLYNWMERGEKNEPEFLHFLQTIKEMRAEVELELIEIVKDATKKDYQAAKWMLAHINNEAWGDKSEQKIEHTGKIDSDIVFRFETVKHGIDSTTSPTTKTTTSNGSITPV
uniref:Putative DNA binding, helix-turn-helix domain containing protein n=1 Tax=viral metagenome TaxID=1070528 RepID=A0A6M3L1V5_9ZZZZ